MRRQAQLFGESARKPVLASLDKNIFQNVIIDLATGQYESIINLEMLWDIKADDYWMGIKFFILNTAHMLGIDMILCSTENAIVLLMQSGLEFRCILMSKS